MEAGALRRRRWRRGRRQLRRPAAAAMAGFQLRPNRCRAWKGSLLDPALCSAEVERSPLRKQRVSRVRSLIASERACSFRYHEEPSSRGPGNCYMAGGALVTKAGTGPCQARGIKVSRVLK